MITLNEMKKELENKKEEKHKLEKKIAILKTKILMLEQPQRVCPKCNAGFLYDDGFGYADVRMCNKCNYTISN